MSIAVITPSRPDRPHMLQRVIECVGAQTLQPAEHLIGIDYAAQGPALIRNQLIAASTSEWLAFVDDDDLIDPDHLATMHKYTDEADVIIPYCRFDGPPLPSRYYNQPFNRRILSRHGIFPITVLARRQSITAAGCFPLDARYEDHVLWNRMADLGSRFVVVPVITWTYSRGHHSRTTHP